MREAVREGNNQLKDRLTVKLENDMRYGEVRLDHWLLHAKVVDLPTIIESLKTIDNKSFYKTADVCQLLICKEEPDLPVTEDESPNKNKKKDPNKVDKKYLWPHGITPPCKNIRKRRFRKTLKKKFVEAPEIEKEVKRLLRADNEAVKCSWDLVTDDQDEHKNIQSLQNELGMPDSSMGGGTGSMSGSGVGPSERNKKGKTKDKNSDRHSGGDSTQMPRDIDIFGEDLSSSDEDDHHNINVELDENSRLSADDSRLSDYSMHGINVGGQNSNSMHDKLVTEFNKSMFNSPKSNISSSGQDSRTPSRRPGGIGVGVLHGATDIYDTDRHHDSDDNDFVPQVSFFFLSILYSSVQCPFRDFIFVPCAKLVCAQTNFSLFFCSLFHYSLFLLSLLSR